MKIKKLLVTVFIIAFALLRLFQASRHFKNYCHSYRRFISPAPAFSLIVAICSLLLLIATLSESLILLEVWILLTILKSAALLIIFDLNLEENSFFENSKSINITITLSESFFTAQESPLPVD
jgi:hypothetical protein